MDINVLLSEAKVQDQVAKIKVRYLSWMLSKQIAAKTADLTSGVDTDKPYVQALISAMTMAMHNPIEAMTWPASNQRGAELEDKVIGDVGALLRNKSIHFDKLANADPSQSKKYLSWIIRIEQNGDHLFTDDLGKLSEYLDILNRGKVPGFDINKIKSIPELYEVVRPHLQAKYDALYADAKKKIDAETVYRYHGPEGMILIPKTKLAAQFWGKDTNWCTSHPKDSHNYFAEYTAIAPLYIFIMPDGKKFQLYLGTIHGREGQFMDETDQRVNETGFQRTYPWAKEKLNLGMDDIMLLFNPGQHFYLAISWLPEAMLHSMKLVEYAIQQDPKCLSWFPPSMRETILLREPERLAGMGSLEVSDIVAAFKGLRQIHDQGRTPIQQIQRMAGLLLGRFDASKKDQKNNTLWALENKYLTPDMLPDNHREYVQSGVFPADKEQDFANRIMKAVAKQSAERRAQQGRTEG